MNDFFLFKGIIHQRWCVESPQLNRIVERKHQHVLNEVRALSFRASLPSNFRHFSLIHVVHLINRLPTPLIEVKNTYDCCLKNLPLSFALEPSVAQPMPLPIKQIKPNLCLEPEKLCFLDIDAPKASSYMISLLTPSSYPKMFLWENLSFHNTSQPIEPTPSSFL